eukprot:14387918-Alexandrium_andersonii.AAC.1
MCIRDRTSVIGARPPGEDRGRVDEVEYQRNLRAYRQKMEKTESLTLYRKRRGNLKDDHGAKMMEARKRINAM